MGPKKKKTPPPKKPKVTAASQGRRRGSSHAGETYNNWTKEELAAVWVDYRMALQKAGGDPKKVSARAIARARGFPETTFWKRVTGRVTGDDHRSGGRKSPRKLSVGQYNMYRYLFCFKCCFV